MESVGTKGSWTGLRPPGMPPMMPQRPAFVEDAECAVHGVKRSKTQMVGDDEGGWMCYGVYTCQNSHGRLLK